MDGDYLVIFKKVKENFKSFSWVLESLHLNFTLFAFLQVGQWIVKANVGNFMRFIKPKQLVHLRMDKIQIWSSFAHCVNYQELF